MDMGNGWNLEDEAWRKGEDWRGTKEDSRTDKPKIGEK